MVKDSLYLSSDLVEVWLVKLERKKKNKRDGNVKKKQQQHDLVLFQILFRENRPSRWQ